MSEYIQTVSEGGRWSHEATLDAAVAQWSTGGRIVEVIGSPRKVNIRFYVNNGWDPRGWYISTGMRVDIRTKSSRRSRTWSYNTLTYAVSREYTPEVR